jgi:hypothetical protein
VSGVRIAAQLPIKMSNSSVLFAMNADLQRFSLFDQIDVSLNTRFSMSAEFSTLRFYSKAMAARGFRLGLRADFDMQDQPQGVISDNDSSYKKTYQANSYFSYPIFAQDYLTLSGSMNYSTSNFSMNAESQSEVYSALVNKDLKLHGVKNSVLLSNKVFQFDLEYHIPLAHPSATIGSSMFAIERFVLSPSISAVGDWSLNDSESDLKNSKANAAIELQSDVFAGFNLPLSINMGVAKMITPVEGKYPTEVYFKLETRL